MLRGSDEQMQELKRVAVENKHVIKNNLGISISVKHTPIAIAQKLLGKIDLRLSYVGRLGERGKRERVYQFVKPDDGRDYIFEKWFSRDEAAIAKSSELRKAANCLVSTTNNIDLTTPITDTRDTSQRLNEAVGGWKGLRLKLRQGLESAGSLYQQLVSSFGEAVGVADGEPIWNGYLGQWQVWVSFADGCRAVGCDWVVSV